MAGGALARQESGRALARAHASRSSATRIQATSTDPTEVRRLLGFLGEVTVAQDCLGRFFFEMGWMEIGDLVAFRLRFDCAATITWIRPDGPTYVQAVDDPAVECGGVVAESGAVLKCPPYVTLAGVVAPRGFLSRRGCGGGAIALPGPTPARSARILVASLNRLFTESDLQPSDREIDAQGERLAALLAATVADLIPAPSSALQRVERHIAEHLDGNLSAAALAAVGGVSVRSLTRLFQDQFGTTPRRYVAHVRMEAACRMLREAPGISLRKLALGLGYADYSSFWRHFNAHFGKSPRRAIG
jgi:AraC-like DNA-binding protein